MSRSTLVYGCVLGAMLAALFASQAVSWPSGAIRATDGCDDTNEAVAFVCRNTWMAHLKTSYR